MSDTGEALAAGSAAAQREAFVRALARLLAGPVVARWSIGVQLKDSLAGAVRDVRDPTGLFGYPTVEEAEAHLRRFLWP